MFKDHPKHGFVVLTEGTHLEVKEIDFQDHGVVALEQHPEKGETKVFLPYTAIVRIDFAKDK